MSRRHLTLLLLAAFAGGAAMQALLHQLTPAHAGDPVDGPKTVAASSFVLNDAAGKPRAKLAFDEAGSPNLWLADKSGKWYPQLADVDAIARDKAAAVALRAAIKKLLASPEHDAPKVKVEHILIAFRGAPRIQGVTRSLEEAERLTARLLKQIQAGADFGALRKKYSDDPGPGIYPMSKDNRQRMVPHFGNVAWRLKVGEVGVAPHDRQKSPFGFHIIKRVE